MREYKYKAITDGSEFEDYTIKLHEEETREQILDNFFCHSEDDVCWAKEINGEIFYSKDEIYNTEKQDATHLVIFIK